MGGQFISLGFKNKVYNLIHLWPFYDRECLYSDLTAQTAAQDRRMVILR